jgi:hypothetical protein
MSQMGRRRQRIFPAYNNKCTVIMKTLRRRRRLAGVRVAESQEKAKRWFAANTEETKI